MDLVTRGDTYDLIKIDKTIYDKPEKSDGKRILVTTLWPRGIKKEKVDLWIKELGTPREFIKKWKSGSIPWSEVAKEYRKVLRNNQSRLKDLAKLSLDGDITLLCSCKDPKTCHRSLIAKEIERIEKIH